MFRVDGKTNKKGFFLAKNYNRNTQGAEKKATNYLYIQSNEAYKSGEIFFDMQILHDLQTDH